MIAKQNHTYYVGNESATIKAGQELKPFGIITQEMINKTLESRIYAQEKKMIKVPSAKNMAKKLTKKPLEQNKV